MMEFLEQKLNIVMDGSWNTNEIIAAAAAAVLVLLLVWLVIKITGRIAARLNPRKSTIFSHRKNKYKNKIGKKVKY